MSCAVSVTKSGRKTETAIETWFYSVLIWADYIQLTIVDLSLKFERCKS